MKIAFLHTQTIFTLELLQSLRNTLVHHEVVEWIGGKDAPALDIEVLLAMGDVGRGVLLNQPELTLIQTASDWYEGVDIDAARELGIWVSYAPADLTGNATSVAEFAVFLLLGSGQQRGNCHQTERRLCGQLAHELECVLKAPKRIREFWVDQQGVHRPPH
jgi:lactate dehydrogenase-like 2-hydroxyacid dehydrogenase